MATHHPVCPSCAKRTRIRFALSRFFKTALFACLIAVLLILVPMVVFTFGLLAFARDMLPVFALGSLVAIILCSLVIWATRQVWIFAVPGLLRKIGRYPFEPMRLTDLPPR